MAVGSEVIAEALPAERGTLSRERLLRALAAPPVTVAHQFGSHPRVGFSPDFLGLASAVTRCLLRGIGFRLGRVHRPRGFAIRSGWADYFEPFCEEVDAPLIDPLNRYGFPYQRRLPFVPAAARAWLRRTSQPRARYFMFDDLERVPPLPAQDAAFAGRDFGELRQEIVPLLWRFDRETSEEVAAWRASLELPSGYVSLCIRRGDKHLEHPFVEVERYARHVRERAGNVGTLFVATDDSRVLAEVTALLPGYAVRSLAGPDADGYHHREFVRLPAAERRRRIVRFLAEVETMRGAALFFGSGTTNVSWLVNLHRRGEGMVWVDAEGGGEGS